MSSPSTDPNPEENLTRRGIQLVARFFRTHPLPAGASLIGAVGYAAAAVGLTRATGWAIDRFVRAATRPDQRELMIGVAVLTALGVAKGVTVVVRRYFAAMFEARMQVTLRTAVIDTYLSAPMSFFSRHPTGELLAHSDADVAGTTMLIKPLPFSLGLIALVVFAVINLWLVDVWFVVVALLLFPALVILNRAYTRRMEVPSAAVQRRIGEVSSVAHESFDGALLVRTMGLRDEETERFSQAVWQLRDQRIAVARLRSMFEPLFDLLPSLGSLALIVVGTLRISHGAVTPGELVGAAALFSILALPMRIFGFFLEEVPRAVVSVDRVDSITREPHAPTGTSSIGERTGTALRFRDVSFAYDAQPVLDGVTFEVGDGEVVALVGTTGSGKSTLVNLAANLEYPESGVVELGGVDITTLSREAIADHLGVALQEAFIFRTTARENVTLGRDQGSGAFNAAVDCARIAGLEAHLPNGWETEVGERGVTLSGGQRQRLALARVLIRRPTVMVLDDATSAVDPAVEAEILDGLRQLRTALLIVAHRRSTIMLADRIVLLEKGRITATGTHEDLLAYPSYVAIVDAYDREEQP